MSGLSPGPQTRHLSGATRSQAAPFWLINTAKTISLLSKPLCEGLAKCPLHSHTIFHKMLRATRLNLWLKSLNSNSYADMLASRDTPIIPWCLQGRRKCWLHTVTLQDKKTQIPKRQNHELMYHLKACRKLCPDAVVFVYMHGLCGCNQEYS